VIPALKRMRLFETRREAGKQAFAKKEWQEAVERYTEALAVDPENEHVQVLFMSNRALALNAVSFF
jgi:DnaJ family protein C protein 7